MNKFLSSFLLLFFLMISNVFAQGMQNPPVNWSLFPAQSDIISDGSNSYSFGTAQNPFKMAYFSNIIVNSSVVINSNDLSSTSLGSEGIRKIGALGGYTLEEFIEDTGVRGVARDYPIFTYSGAPASDLTVSWTTGDVYSPVNGYFHPVGGTNTLTDNSVNYAYWSMVSPNTIQWTTTRPAVTNNVIVAIFVASFGMIVEFDPPEAAGEFPLNTRSGAANIAPSLVVNGLEHYAVATNLNAIIMNAGVEYHDMRYRKEHTPQDLRNPAITTGIIAFGHTNVGVWGYSMTNQFPVGLWDNGTNIVVGDSTNWYKGLFLSLPNSPMMFYIYPQVAYTSSVDAIAGFDPALPPGFFPYIPLCTEYVFKGDDTSLRIDSQYWVDRRFQIRRPGSSVVSSGGSAPTPALTQVMIAGSSLGGILPHDAGRPIDPDQLANKDYVDSTINNINYGRAYVDQNGDDVTAQVRNSVLPFKTIQAAINAASAVANDTNRFVVTLSPGSYTEDITMSNYVSISGADIEATEIFGSILYPPTFTDTTGAEVSLVTIHTYNRPVMTFNNGVDNAYAGIRSCYLIADYDDSIATKKTAVLIQRGQIESYGTTYTELNIKTNDAYAARVQIFEHTTDIGNSGLSTFTSFNGSSVINCIDTNDDISIMFTHDNQDAKTINTIHGGMFDVFLNNPTEIHANSIKTMSHKKAIGRTLSMANVIRLDMPLTNNCNIYMAYAEEGTGDNVAIVRGGHIRMTTGSTSNIWIGAAVNSNDVIRVYDTVYIQNLTNMPYPQIYTNAGTAGKRYVNTVTENGDHLFGSCVDLSIVNSGSISTPSSGHIKMYASPYAGFENLYLKDSSGNTMRDMRDNFYNGYNDDIETIKVGDPVYISAGLSADNTPKIKKSKANDASTLPAVGVVASVGGITTGKVGRVMIMGRLENYTDTSCFTSGQKLYVAVGGGVTNVAPTGTNIAQAVGTCHISSTNGFYNVLVRGPDTIGGMTPSVLNAATVGGYTPEELIAQQQTYYTWGSLAGSFPGSRLVQIEKPANMPPRTNIYTAVTNDQKFSGLCINTNENPTMLTKGVVAIHTTTSRTGDNTTKTLKGRLTIYESDLTTIVARYYSMTNMSVVCVTNINENVLLIEVLDDLPIKDLHRVIVGDTMSDTGWTGVENISFYSQDGYLSRLVIPAPSAGIYAPLGDVTTLQDQTNIWNEAYSWVNNNSNTVTYTFSRTSVWNATSATVSAMPTSNWNIAYNYINTHSNSLDYMQTRTDTWDKAVTDAISATNAISIIQSRTSTWNTASTWVTANSNSLADVLTKTSTWNTASTWVTVNSNSLADVLTKTSSWNTASTWVTANSNSVSDVLSKTSSWNKAVTDAISATGAVSVIQSRTSSWNTAYVWATNDANQDTNVFNVMIANYPTSNWNTAYVWATNDANQDTNVFNVMIANYPTSNWNEAYTHSTNSGAQISNIWNTMMAAYPTVCEQSIGTGKTQTFTLGGVIVTNWSDVHLSGTNFITTQSNITVLVAGTYTISSHGSWQVQNGDLRGVLFTNGVAAVDGGGNGISWRCNNQNNGIYVSFGVSRNINLSAGVRLEWRVNSVSATEILVWDNANWEVKKL